MSYPGTTQYQRLAEPVVSSPLDTGETVLVDKWFHQTSTPTRRQKTVAAIAPFIAFVNFAATEPLDALTIDKWFVRQPDPTRREPRAAEFQSFAIDASHLGDPETVTLDKWFVRGPDPTRRLRRAAEFFAFFTDPARLLDGETVTIDKWLGSDEIPVRRQRPAIPDQARDPLQDLSVAETVTLDKWLVQKPDPTRRLARVPWFHQFVTDSARLLDSESITIDKWIGSGEVPTKRSRPRLSDQIRDPLQDVAGAESITLDKWFSASPGPAKRRESARPDFLAFTIGEALTIDKWSASYPSSARRLSPRGLGFLAFTTPEEPTIDKWGASAPSIILPRKPRVLAQFLAFTELDIVPPESITIDKWWQQASEPQRQPRKLAARYARVRAFTELEIIPVSWTTYGGPFLYTAANWSASTEFYFEAYFRASVGTARARLVNQSGSPVSGSEVSTTSATHVRLRSGAITLANGDEYFAQFGEDTGSTGFFLLARVIGI